VKKIFSLILPIIFFSFITGCMAIGAFRNPTIKSVNNELSITQPSKVSRKDLVAIKKILVVPIADQTQDPDDRRMLEIARGIVRSELKKSKKFKLISGNAFREKKNELDIEIDASIMIEEELEEAYTEIGRALGCDAMLAVYLKVKKVNMGKAVFKGLLVGMVDVPMTAALDLLGTKSGKTIWLQEHELVISAGEMGLKNTRQDELKQMLSPAIKPLTDSFLSSFE